MLRCWVLTSEVNPLITFRTSRCIKDSSGVVGGTEAHDSGDGVVKEGGGGGERERDGGGGGGEGERDGGCEEREAFTDCEAYSLHWLCRRLHLADRMSMVSD